MYKASMNFLHGTEMIHRGQEFETVPDDLIRLGLVREIKTVKPEVPNVVKHASNRPSKPGHKR